jgi:hypothetical protein
VASTVTALADLTRADRRRLLEHIGDEDELDRLAGLARLMREPGGLPSVPEPLPLCRTARTLPPPRSPNSSTTLSTPERTTTS